MIYEKSKNISFPLGGIGSGCIGLAGNGSLIDWEIFNRPNKNTYNGYSHFAIKATRGGKSITKVLQGDTNEDLMGRPDREAKFIGFGFGPHTNSMAGFPHFKNTAFNGSFPIASLDFSDEDYPLTVKMTAFNPFIPHDALNSSIPAAFFVFEVENITDGEVKCDIAFSLQNPAHSSQNIAFDSNGAKGIFFRDAEKSENEIGYSDMCIITDNKNATTQECWYRGGWQDSVTMFWKNFSECDTMPIRTYEAPGRYDHGSLIASAKLSGKEKTKMRFVLTWSVPNQYNYWNPLKDENGKDVTWKNYYATVFGTSKDSALYAINKFSELYKKTADFSDAINASTLPGDVIDAVSANLSVLKSPTVLRLEDGSFWAWEGCHETEGSCEGSCQHVWNYAYAMPFLFPDLERSMRENTIKHATTKDGATKFRVPLPLGRDIGTGFRACVDGQMGEIIKCFREWKVSGDSAWLKEHSDAIFKMLEYAWSDKNADAWDADMDGIIEGRQHHTLDMELFGPNSWLEGFYLLALDCASQMADALGESERSEKYKKLYENGRKWMNENLFNGSYFCQKIDLCDKNIIDSFEASERYWNDETGEIKYQIADGCIIDQMLADWHAALIGCDPVFDSDKKNTALKSLYKNNYKSSMREVTNMWRNFALNDEGGTVICSYPEGATVPKIPVPYCEECMTGFEYSLAGLMIANGHTKEGEEMVSAVRGRYDGEKRNPWNEIECGSNYARSMASYALMNIYSGFSFDMTKGYIGFSPLSDGKGIYVWSVGDTWGSITIGDDLASLTVSGSPLTLSEFGIAQSKRITSVKADGTDVNFSVEQDKIVLGKITVKDRLEISLI